MILPQFFENPFLVRLSFHKIIEMYEKAAAETGGVEAGTAKTLLKQVAAHPELKEGITDISQIRDNSQLISRLLAQLFPAALTLNEIKAISIPYQGLIFNYSERFRNILNDAGPNFEINIRDFDDHQFYVFSCCIILNRCYGTRIDFVRPLFYDIPTKNGIVKHYRILYNADFMEVLPLKEMPVLSTNDIKLLLDSYDDLDLWKEKFPPQSWIMKGFSIMTLVDVTVQNAVSILKDTLLGNVTGQDLQHTLQSIFSSIFQTTDVQTGFTLYDELSGKLSTLAFGQKIRSYILIGRHEADFTNIICDDSYQSLIKEHAYFAVSDVGGFLAKSPDSYIARNFNGQNIKSFILAPVIKNKILLGFLELVSFNTGEFNSVNANNLDVVMPFLVDSIDRKINEFQNRLRAVIQNNYTTLHPSVNWKFEREAKNYIQALDSGLAYEVKKITFRKVYPLYGEVDIQNSSITRNLSVENDLTNQLQQLISLLEQLNQHVATDISQQRLIDLRALADDLSSGIKADTEQSVEHYLELNIYSLLQQAGTLSVQLSNNIESYFEQADRLTGDFYQNRRNYEKTISLVNDKVAGILDKRQIEIQKYYPHYYERFKTDGVEHNLYIGSAISPDKDFNDSHLKRLRLWQLLVTAEMEMEQYRLKEVLPYHLGVTTLILVFSTPIDIRFRMDEKHFDIDGVYNIRYEVIKKRIDKACIKNTSERITMQGKITIVYTKPEEEAEYQTYLAILKDAGVLEGKIEDFDVEDLQGVSGLRALRVGIAYDQKLLLRYDGIYEDLYNRLK